MRWKGIPGFALVLLVLFPGLSAAQEEHFVSCSAEAVWLNCQEGRVASRTPGPPLTMHLLAQVSLPSRECSPAQVTLSAAYLSRDGEVLCVGTLEALASVRRQVQDVAFELGPGVLRTFARWKNEPGRRSDPAFEALRCVAPDGRTELLDTHLETATAIELTATLLPREGGLASARCRLPFR